MALAVSEAELDALLVSVPFTRAYGFRLRALAEGRCVLAVPFQKAFERPGGIVSGQVFMAAAVILALLDGVSLQLTFEPQAFSVAAAVRVCEDALLRYLGREAR